MIILKLIRFNKNDNEIFIEATIPLIAELLTLCL